MAYPFSQAPTVKDFLKSLEPLHCEVLTLDNPLVGPRGKVDVRYVRRTVDGAELFSEPLPNDLNERISPDSMRRWIKQLNLPSSVWPWAGAPDDLD